MEWLHALHPWIAVGVTLCVFLILQIRRGIATDLLFLCALLAVTLSGIITPEEAMRGFANQAVLTIAGLLAVAAGLRSSGVLDWIGRKLLGDTKTERGALLRLIPALLAGSAFLLNTALVAMAMPVVLDWCRRNQIAPSRLLIPVSYLAILGGVCTLIGTSTTLVANDILRTEYHDRAANLPPDVLETIAPMQLLEIGWIGVPCALVGGAFLIVMAFTPLGRFLLPRRSDIVEQVDEMRREYLVEMMVEGNCPYLGSTVEQAGLRSLPGLFLIEIDRDGEVITPVDRNEKLHADDRLIFTGIVSTILDLEKIPGLVPVADTAYENSPQLRQQRRLTEVVLSRTSPLIGSTVREANFRQRYQAAVVAVHRSGVRLTSKIGEIRLEPGDTLLLQTRHNFVPTFRNNRDFYLVSSVQGSTPRRHHKFRTALVLAGILIVWLIAAACSPQLREVLPGFGSPAIAALAIAAAMVLTRCVPLSESRTAIDIPMLTTIAAALGLGLALRESGAATAIAQTLVDFVGERPYLLLALMYILAILFTETITNNAVVAMLLPLSIEVALRGGYNPRPFVMVVTLAASLSFITPIGYQTNLMVMGPGGYRPSDYLKCGTPLATLVFVTAFLVVPMIWPLTIVPS